MRATEAIAHVQTKRGIVAPNLGFRRQLATWERQFEDAKTKAAAEQRRKARSVCYFGDALSKWIGKSKLTGLSKRRSQET